MGTKSAAAVGVGVGVLVLALAGCSRGPTLEQVLEDLPAPTPAASHAQVAAADLPKPPGYSDPSLAESAAIRAAEEARLMEGLAASHVSAARQAGASGLDAALLNRVAAEACVQVLSGSADIDVVLDAAVSTYAPDVGQPGAVVREELRAALSVAGMYCPRLWDEFQGWAASP